MPGPSQTPLDSSRRRSLSPRDDGVPDSGAFDPGEETPERIAELRAWLRLQQALVFEPERALECLRRTGGDPAAALRLARPVEGPGEPQLDACVRSLRRCGIRVVPVVSPGYPELLRQLADPPPLLFVAGCVDLISRPAVAIVGARAASVYGLAVARELAGELARAGVGVVSGLARGIDGAAHEGALEAGGPTVAVAACGPDRVYPPEHRELARRICDRGAVISEFPPGVAPRAQHFPLRNRLISGLCKLTIVVEGRQRSGSLITARHAADQNRDVMAVPGPIHAPTSWGPNRLIRDGAPPVLEIEDVFRELRWSSPPAVSRTGGETPGELGKIEAEILDLLARERLTRSDLTVRMGRGVAELSLHLLELELRGWVLEDRDGFLRVSPSRGIARRDGGAVPERGDGGATST